MFHIALFEPEIPPNTGNIIRLCANTNSQLHLIGQLGFDLDDKKMRRAGLDYHEYTAIKRYSNFEDFLIQQKPKRLFAYSTKGTTYYHKISYHPDDVLLFGPETRGLPDSILKTTPSNHTVKIPMAPHNRSLNLSNAVAVVLYEAWHQNDFKIE